jgi:lysyl-tRNA synthetase class 2
MISVMRNFLDQQGYLEVETPMMQPLYGGALARPFVTHHNTLDIDLYLRIAPELYLKRLVVGGMEKVYEINRNFRNEGISTRHNPEFTMLELYTAYWNYEDTMCLIEKVFQTCAMELNGTTKLTIKDREMDFGGTWKRISVLEAIEQKLGVSVSWEDSPESLKEKLAGQGNIEELDDSFAIIMTVFESHVEKDLFEPTFIIDYPSAISPLARRKSDNPKIAERFELFIAGMEMANGYSELVDPFEQKQNFEGQLEQRKGGDMEAHTMDEDYVMALEHGLPTVSGLGIGIDRMAMLFNDCDSIRDVILFPLMRPESE